LALLQVFIPFTCSIAKMPLDAENFKRRIGITEKLTELEGIAEKLTKLEGITGVVNHKF